MKEIIEDIRVKLKNNSYNNEQHVRFSLVGRICQALGWDIWNPEEFYTEYPVKKFPPQDVTKDITGKVDVALFLADKQTGTAEVFIEVKSPGKLDNELQSGQFKLQRYNFYDKSVISILTDGTKWRFYLPLESGTFEDTLINEINILTDSVDSIIAVMQVLKRDNYRKKARQIAEDRHEELGKIKLIMKVISEGEEIASKTGTSIFTIVQQLLKNLYKINMDVIEIEYLLSKIIPGGDTTPPPPSPPPGIKTNPLDDYSYMEVKFIEINHGPRINLKHWRDVKKHVYNYIIKNFPNVKLEGALGYSKKQADYRRAITLDGGWFTEGNLSATYIVKHSREALEVAQKFPKQTLTIGYTESKLQKKKQ